MGLNGDKIILTFIYTSYKVIQKTATKDTPFKLMLNNPNEIQKAHSNLLFLTERIKIDKCQKRVCNLDKKKNLSYTKKP